MPALEYFVVCRSVSFDVDTDEVTLSNVVEDVHLDDDGTAVLPRVVAVSSWNVGDGDESRDYQTLLRITLPGEAKGADFPVNLDKQRHRHRAIITIIGVPLTKSGELLFEVFLNAHREATHKVIVHPPGTRAKVGTQLVSGTGE